MPPRAVTPHLASATSEQRIAPEECRVGIPTHSQRLVKRVLCELIILQAYLDKVRVVHKSFSPRRVRLNRLFEERARLGVGAAHVREEDPVVAEVLRCPATRGGEVGECAQNMRRCRKIISNR